MTVGLFKKCYASNVVHTHLISTGTVLWCTNAGDTFTFIKGNGQFIKNSTVGLWEKMVAQLRKMFCKILMNARATISLILLS